MNISELDRLMHTVLDGEATPAEAAELDRQLAADLVARQRFDDLKWLFDGFRRVPKAFPPEGLVAAVMAAMPSRPVGRQRLRQLLSRSRVIRQVSMGPRGTIPGASARVHQASQPGPQPRGYKMNEQKSGFIGKRTVWIGAGITAVAVVLVLQYVDFPPSGKDVSGTIVPAQRYRATQNTGDDVKLGDPSTTQQSQTNPVGGANAGVGSSGVGSSGVGSSGVGSSGFGSSGIGSSGIGSSGIGSSGVGSSGVGSSGVGSSGVGSSGVGSSGVGSSGVGSSGVGSSGVGSSGIGSSGHGSSGVGSSGIGSSGVGSSGVGSSGHGSSGVGSSGVGSSGVGSSGIGSSGVGSSAAGSSGAGSSAAPN
jgi:hypothetical protein